MGSRISVTIQSGSSRFPIPDLPSSTKVIALKKEIFQYTGIYINNQTLKFKGVVLQDRYSLEECGVRTNDIIEVEERDEDSHKIFIESIHGNILKTLDFNPDDTILCIKHCFLRDLNIQIERQKLFFTTILLMDNEKLSKYKIQEGTKLRLEVTQLDPNCIMVEMPHGPVLDLEYNKDLTIDNLKQTISSTAMIHTDEIRLFFKEEQLEARKSLSKYHIKVGDTLKLKLRQKGEIIIYIDAPTTKQIVNNLTLENTINDIKAKITNEAKIPLEKQSLYMDGVVLEDGRTLLQSGIEDGSVIKLVLEGPTIMSIFVRFNSEKLPLDVDSKSTVLNLKIILERVTRVAVDAQKLVFAGKLLENDNILSSYGIQKEMTVDLIQQFKQEELQIVVKTLNDNDFPISVLPQTKISEIKETISRKEFSTADQFQLTFSGIILKDDATVSSYNIVMESCLHMELQREDNAPQPPVRMTSYPFRDASRMYRELPQPINIQQDNDPPAVFEQSHLDENSESIYPVHKNEVSSSSQNILDPFPEDGRIPFILPNKFETYNPDLLPPIYRSFSPIESNSAILGRLRDNLYSKGKTDRHYSNNLPSTQDAYGQPNISRFLNLPLPILPPCKIENDTEVSIVVPLPSVPEHKITIRVSILCSEDVNIEIRDNVTILEVKSVIKSKKGFIEEHQRIYFNSSICGDTQILTDLEIVDGSEIEVDILHSWIVCFLHHKMNFKCFSSSKIADIKNCIFEKEKIPVEKQRLSLDERELPNEQSLRDFQPGQNLKFILELTTNISILFASGKLFILHSCHMELSGKSIKDKIYQNFKVPVENQTLTYLGREFRDDLTLEAIKFREENRIMLDIDYENSKLITVLLKLANGDQQIVNIRSLDTVGKLKSLVNNTSSLLVDDHYFTYNNSNLSDENVIAFYQIRNYGEISISSSEFKVVNVTLLSGCVEPFCLKHFQTLDNIKIQMQNQFRLPPNYNNLFFENSRNLVNFNPQYISNGENMFLGPNDSMLVTILSPNSRTIEVLVTKGERVISLKQKIEMKEHIPIHVQQLSFEGNPMNNDTCIGNFNISSYDTIFLIISDTEDPVSINLTDDANNTIHFPQIDRYRSVAVLINNLTQMGYTIRDDDLIVFGGTVLRSNAPLCYYGIQNRCNLRLISRTMFDCLSSSHRGSMSDVRVHLQHHNRFNTPRRYHGESVVCTYCSHIECVCVFRAHAHSESNIRFSHRQEVVPPLYNRQKSGPIQQHIHQQHHYHTKISDPYLNSSLSPSCQPHPNTSQDRTYQDQYQPPSSQQSGNYDDNYP